MHLSRYISLLSCTLCFEFSAESNVIYPLSDNWEQRIIHESNEITIWCIDYLLITHAFINWDLCIRNISRVQYGLSIVTIHRILISHFKSIRVIIVRDTGTYRSEVTRESRHFQNFQLLGKRRGGRGLGTDRLRMQALRRV